MRSGRFRRPETSRPLNPGTVLLLHGLARGPGSLRRMALALQAAGFDVSNLSYPTRRRTLGALVELVHAKLAALEPPSSVEPVVHGVGHSLGGVVLRAVLAEPPPPWRAGRLVTIAAPHRGARVVGPMLRNIAARRSSARCSPTSRGEAKRCAPSRRMMTV